MNQIEAFDSHPCTPFVLGDGCEMQVYQNVCASELENCWLHLKKSAGFALYAEHKIGENLYRTYRLQTGGILHFSYTAADQSLRVVQDPLNGNCRTLPPMKAAPYQKICEPKATVMALDYTIQNVTDANGMSFVFQLEDGSFVIFDGGYLEDAPRLFSYLLDQTPLPNHEIVISAWIMTHSHCDHYRCFVGFSRMFAERVTVKYFVLNSPPADPAIIRLKNHDNFLCDEFFQCVKRFRGAQAVRIHTGQTFALPGATLEFLQTYEDILPEPADWLNETSLVTRVYIGGQTFLFMGDEELKADKRLVLQGEALKSDFLQVTHHAYSGGTPEVFRLIDPQYLIWTTNFECYCIRTMRGWRKSLYCSLLNDMNVKHSFVSDGAFKIIPLPLKKIEDVKFYIPRNLVDVEQVKGVHH